MGGGNSKIKVDGIPPKKKMELSSVGNNECLNFINLNNSLKESRVVVNGNTMDRLITFEKDENYIYAIATYSTGQVYDPTFVIRYNFKTGWDKKFGIDIGISVSNREEVVSVILINDDEILMSSYKKIVKINLKTKKIEDVISDKELPGGEKAILFKLENEAYLLTDVYRDTQANYVYKINVENKSVTQVAYNGDSPFINIFMHDNGVWINRSGQYCIFKNGEFTNIGNYPISGKCIKINEKLHLFAESASKPTEHYVLNDNGTWTKKDSLKQDEYLINFRGLNTDIGYIQINRNRSNSFVIITDELYLNKRRE